MPNFNQVILMGHLTRDPELTYTGSGMALCKFGLAVNRKYKDETKVCFIDCTAWAKTAEAINQHVHKGDPLHVVGRLEFEQWEKDGQRCSKHSVTVNEFQFVGGKRTTPDTQTIAAGGAGGNAPRVDEDIPF